MKYAASVEPGCGCRLELYASRWVRVRTCGRAECKARAGAQAARIQRAFTVRATRSGPPPR